MSYDKLDGWESIGDEIKDVLNCIKKDIKKERQFLKRAKEETLPSNLETLNLLIEAKCALIKYYTYKYGEQNEIIDRRRYLVFSGPSRLS